MLEPVSESSLKRFSVELVLMSFLPNNIAHFQVFEDDKNILAFLSNLGTFEDQIINEDDRKNFFGEEDTQPITKLSINVIPKGMATLKCLFDSDPRRKQKLTTDFKDGKYELYNIGYNG